MLKAGLQSSDSSHKKNNCRPFCWLMAEKRRERRKENKSLEIFCTCLCGAASHLSSDCFNWQKKCVALRFNYFTTGALIHLNIRCISLGRDWAIYGWGPLNHCTERFRLSAPFDSRQWVVLFPPPSTGVRCPKAQQVYQNLCCPFVALSFQKPELVPDLILPGGALPACPASTSGGLQLLLDVCYKHCPKVPCPSACCLCFYWQCRNMFFGIDEWVIAIKQLVTVYTFKSYQSASKSVC